MATSRQKQTTRGKRTRSFKSVGQGIIDSPMAREVLAAVLVYAAANMIKDFRRKDSTSSRLLHDLGGLGSQAIGQLGGLSIGKALDTLVSHWRDERPNGSEGNGSSPSRRRASSRRGARKRSTGATSRRSAATHKASAVS